MPVTGDTLSDKELVSYLRRGTIHDFQAQAADRLEQQAAEIAALRAALAARPQPDEPTALDMVTELHRAIYGDTWARSESPQQVWEMLLTRVSGLAQGWCGECERRAEAVAGSATPTGHDHE